MSTATPFESFAARNPPVTHVFVYGTLRLGDHNDITRLQPAPDFVGTAQVAGTLHHLGAYPGIVLGGTGLVQGEVYAITPALELRLDEIECLYLEKTDEYFKRAIDVAVQTPAGGTRRVCCICYEYNRAYLGDAPAIEGGDWVKGRDSVMRN